MKRRPSTAAEGEPAQKRSVTYETFKKWRTDLDRDHQTVSWLDCDTVSEGGKKVVQRLKCSVCSKFKVSIRGRRNFNDRWIVGADSVRTSNVKDHAQSDQHTHAMQLLKKEQGRAAGLGAASYAPIAQALSKLPAEERDRLKKKFDIAYFVATEKLAFTKYPSICELEARHGVELGTSYLNKSAGRTFCHYIAEERKENVVEALRKAHFFSILMDGTTDKGNIEDELFLVLWCDVDGADEKIHTRASYFAVDRPKDATAVGLFESLRNELGRLGIKAIDTKECKKLIGIGTDGAAVNVSALKGKVQSNIPWVYWMWCLAHRLELAVKDALQGTVFDIIDELLLRLYYIYEKSPKKSRELEDIIADLQGCFSFDDSGVRPVRASGTRWISHKVEALKRVLSKFGAYTSHLAALSEDRTVRDRAKLKGYYTKWTDAKYLLGCAVFVDVLTPCATLSKVMQSDDLDVLGAFMSMLRVVKEVGKLGDKSLDEWPTYSATMKKVTETEGEVAYQHQALKAFERAKSLYQSHYREYCTSVTDCLKSRLQWSDLEMIRDVIFVLATHGWQKIIDEEEKSETEGTDGKDVLKPLERLAKWFRTPLEAAGADLSQLQKEFMEMLQYANQFISLATLDYQAVWWRLFHAPSATEWHSALLLAQLLLSLPVSNGKLERCFSTLKLIKSEKRSSLSNDTLDDLLALTVDPIPLKSFNPDASIELWWKDKLRRPNQQPRKAYEKRSGQSSATIDITGDEETPEIELTLDDWDKWMRTDDEEPIELS